MRYFILIIAAAAAMLLILNTGCGTDKKTETDTDSAQGDNEVASDADNNLPPEICLNPAEGPYTLKFTDVTKDYGFNKEALNVAGTNVTITDLDGDNWPDIYITKGTRSMETPDAPQGLYRLLKNINGTSFEETTWTSGLFKTRSGNQGRVSSFIIWGDINNDGFKDAFNIASYDQSTDPVLDKSAIFINNGDGTFTIAPDQIFTVPDYTDPTTGAAFLDYDKDGILDLFVGHHYGSYGDIGSSVMDTLHKGSGNGSFNDVTESSKCSTLPDYSFEAMTANRNNKPSWGVTACDVDGDGWTDMMTTTYGRGFNNFWRNLGGTFEDLSLSSGFASDKGEDYSDDQWYLCYCASHPEAVDYCAGAAKPLITCTGLENAWEPGWSDQPFRLGGNNSNTVCGDFDGDGNMDLLSVSLAHWHIGKASDKTELLMNRGFPAVPFDRPGRDNMGLGRKHSTGSWDEGDLGAEAADFDNDGRLDILVNSSDYPGTFSVLYQQQADGTFIETGKEAGARVNRNHGAGLIDIDRDGDYDLVMATTLMRWKSTDIPPAPEQPWVYILRNDTGQNANKVMVHLEGAGKPGMTNKDAVGSRIIVKAGGKQFIREVQGGYGLQGIQQDPLMIIGLGSICQVDEVEIHWNNKDNTVSSFKNVRANYVLKINEETGLTHLTLAEYAPKK